MPHYPPRNPFLIPLRQMVWILIITLATLSHAFSATLTITPDQLRRVADQIYQNEASGKKENLIVWNEGENFPSLGIGHFIWYKANERGIFEESFPQLVQFLRAKGAKLPLILERHQTAPWPNREHFLTNRHNAAATELREFLYQTRDLQILFIFQRLEGALDKMMAASRDPNTVKTRFYRVANANNGLYALIDYVNFKGEGVNPNERYRGEGWGLLQVLEGMPSSEGDDATIMRNFSESAANVLTRRVNNADPARNEGRWLRGWLNRCATYRLVK